jgi:hypothetical protein
VENGRWLFASKNERERKRERKKREKKRESERRKEETPRVWGALMENVIAEM